MQCTCGFECGTVKALQRHLDRTLANPDGKEHGFVGEEMPAGPTPRKGSVEAIQEKRKAAAAALRVPYKCSCRYTCGSEDAWIRHLYTTQKEKASHTRVYQSPRTPSASGEDSEEVDGPCISPPLQLALCGRLSMSPSVSPAVPSTSGRSTREDYENEQNGETTPCNGKLSAVPLRDRVLFLQNNPMFDAEPERSFLHGEYDMAEHLEEDLSVHFQDELYTPLSRRCPFSAKKFSPSWNPRNDRWVTAVPCHLNKENVGENDTWNVNRLHVKSTGREECASNKYSSPARLPFSPMVTHNNVLFMP
mmetsp:Transcript_17710/g.38638  ORF Transcript_17710/g.38638 Transcript_17710/m.38638 type:complete len:305 (+) Transcript_17710:288-1202(+)|eukprot:CAMPEP_0118925546 /NCGR_PEP_ID=MMETSP1169-20130426/3427_1 /TAXON_ID=36882 /ORGANISM="Pyramimonas obovata, Strain CCMP722" /LENGTH=304 /DNA_ID=CAMNT_0006866881 /DNA_START=257 /DNA_END=1171 /DNA_ORIENTATION=-